MEAGLRSVNRNPASHPRLFFPPLGRLASEDVTLSLIKAKCIPQVLYGIEALDIRTAKFLNKFALSDNDICALFVHTARVATVWRCLSYRGSAGGYLFIEVEALPHCRCGVANKNRIV